MFWMRNKENNFPIRTLIWRPGVIGYSLIPNKIVLLSQENNGIFVLANSLDPGEMKHYDSGLFILSSGS